MTNRNPKRFVLGLGALAATLGLPVAAGEVAVQVYECNQGGQSTFSDTPCVGQEQRVAVDYSSPDAAAVQAAAQSAAIEEYQVGRVAEADLLDTEILSVEQRIGRLRTERDARLSALRTQLDQGTESDDAASWEAGLNQQILSVTNSYSDTILAGEARLGELQARRQALGRSVPPSGAGR